MSVLNWVITLKTNSSLFNCQMRSAQPASCYSPAKVQSTKCLMGHFRPPEVVSVILLNKTLFTGSLWAHFKVICSVLVYMSYFAHENITYLNITQIIKLEIIKCDAICYNFSHLLCQKKSNSYKLTILMVRVHVKCLCFGSSLFHVQCNFILQ